MSASTIRSAIVLALLAVTYLGIQSVTGVTRTPILKPLATFPTTLGDWQSITARQSSKDVVELLGVDDYIDYTYRNSKGQQISLYVGFYESVGTGGGYHSPKNCLPGGGWGIAEVATVPLSTVPGTSPSDKASRMVIQNKSEFQVVLYWYQNRGRIISSEYWEKIYLVLDAVFKKRRDGSFIRIMVYAPEGDIAAILPAIHEFAGLVTLQLREFLPGR